MQDRLKVVISYLIDVNNCADFDGAETLEEAADNQRAKLAEEPDELFWFFSRPAWGPGPTIYALRPYRVTNHKSPLRPP